MIVTAYRHLESVLFTIAKRELAAVISESKPRSDSYSPNWRESEPIADGLELIAYASMEQELIVSAVIVLNQFCSPSGSEIWSWQLWSCKSLEYVLIGGQLW